MTKEELIAQLRKWEYDWTHHLNLEDDDPFSQGASAVKRFTLKRLRNLIKEIDG